MSRSDTGTLEFNVGAMTLLALGFFSWMILFVGDANVFGGEYALFADFDEIQLLQRGDPVRKNGLIIGKVDAFRFVGNRVRVTLRIEKGFQIRKDARVAVGNVGLFGANYIKVTEPTLAADQDSPGVYVAQDTIAGETAPEFETLLNEGTRLLGDLRDTVRSLNAILDDDAFRDDFRQTVGQIRAAAEAGRRTLEQLEGAVRRVSRDAEGTLAAARRLVEDEGGIAGAIARLNTMLASVEKASDENRGHLRRTTKAIMTIVEDIRDRALAAKLTGAASQMEAAATELGGMLRDLNKNGQTVDQIRRITARVEGITDDLAAMTTTTREAVTESDLKGNLSRAFDDVHTIAGQVESLGGKLGELRAEVVSSLFYSDEADDFRPDLNASLHLGDRGFLRLGVEDIGGGDDLNLQVGKNLDGRRRLRLGVIADEFGIGYDRYLFGKALQVRLELYRPDDLLFRYATRFRIGDDFFLSFRREDLGSPGGHVNYLGFEKRF